MATESILSPTCYICLEECDGVSPCECKAPVHHKCLCQYRRKSGTNKCTICQGEFQQVFKLCRCILGTILTLLFICMFYIVAGFMGELIWSVTGICDCKHLYSLSTSFIDVIMSSSFALCSVSMFAITGICISFFIFLKKLNS